jgi:peptide/nickel transport system permease protein
VAIVVIAIFPGIVSSQDPFLQNLREALQPPMSTDSKGIFHLLGTDPLGRDLLSRMALGARVSLIVLFGVLPISALVGVTLGLTAGYYGGWTDDIISRLIDVRLAIPFILVLLTVMAVVGPSLLNIILVLGAMQWVDYAKLARAEALSVRVRDFVLSARATGATDRRIIMRHILPNIVPTIIVIMTIEAPHLILTEAALSFLGLGVEPQTPSWGQMLSEARDYIYLSPWYGAFPGIAITLTVLAANLVGDTLRDYFDPFLKGH